MSIRRNGLKALGLSFLAVLGLMAFMAAGAQANWEVESKELAANETVAASAHTPGILVVEKKNLEIRCTTLGSTNLKLLAKSGTAEGEVKFSSCTTFEFKTGKEAKNCKPAEPIVAGGKALLILHPTTSGKTYVLFEPAVAGGKFTTIEFGELCGLTETSEVKGSLVAECGHLQPAGTFVALDCKSENSTQLLRPALATLFPSDTLSFGANPATLSGIAGATLSGGNAGKIWGGVI